jgi:hypothetical protein
MVLELQKPRPVKISCGGPNNMMLTLLSKIQSILYEVDN